MASYQNVSTPRFYIDYLSYNREIKNALIVLPSQEEDWKHVGLDANGLYYNETTDTGNIWVMHQLKNAIPLPDTGNETSRMFIGCMGHNLQSTGYLGENGQEGTGLSLDFRIYDSMDNATYFWSDEIVNFPGTYSEEIPFDGFTIATKRELPGLINIDRIRTKFHVENERDYYTLLPLLYIKSIIFGEYYDMPVAPDLSLSLEHDYSGIKKTTSMSGASFSNADWIKPPKWGDKEAWQLGDFPRPYSGRRIWDLSFSYISDSDLEPRNYTGTLEDNQNQRGAVNWFENVLHYTMGGHLPFIFQPNKDAKYRWTDEEPSHIQEIPEFATCRFDMNSFKREQVAPGVYNIKIKIKESW